mmetsp:Transcript_136996/g.273248  ORF Transcript_136996/g.273248 Transcript_136996/m.273248 type:complete len:229 (-) Transcript_136996:46-732(-)
MIVACEVLPKLCPETCQVFLLEPEVMRDKCALCVGENLDSKDLPDPLMPLANNHGIAKFIVLDQRNFVLAFVQNGPGIERDHITIPDKEPFTQTWNAFVGTKLQDLLIEPTKFVEAPLLGHFAVNFLTAQTWEEMFLAVDVNRGGCPITHARRQFLLRHLRGHYVDCPWGIMFADPLQHSLGAPSLFQYHHHNVKLPLIFSNRQTALLHIAVLLGRFADAAFDFIWLI